jgi:hypothetical protein
MNFKYKKTKYENIFDWASKTDANCFYCNQKHDDLALQLLSGGKGICKSCLDSFEIGHLSTDRHVIHQLMPDFKSRDEAKSWFEKYGKIVLDDVIDGGDQKVYLYDFINANNDTTRLEILEDGSIHIVY